VNVKNFLHSAVDWDNLVERVRKEGTIRNEIIRLKNRMGEDMEVEFTLHPCIEQEEKEIIGLEGIFRDVTQRVRLQKELKNYSKELEKKVEEKTREVLALERKKLHLEGLATLGQMAASIVHEIRNLLSSIKIGLNTLLKRAKLEKKDYRCTELEAQDVTHLEKILQDILIFAKPEEMKFIEHDLKKVLDLTLDQIESEFSEANIVIHRQLAPDLPRVIMDINKISQVILNILINSKQSINRKGKVIVKTHWNKKEKRIVLEIRDNGFGIEEESLKKVFDPFSAIKKKVPSWD
jgi:signal transduction histidine kinase